MSTVSLYPGDNRQTLRRLIDEGFRVHSVCTDPPYGLTSVVKRFGKEGSAPALYGADGAFARASAGFMGKAWDGTGIERDPEFWRLIWEILLPGGFCFAFSGSRTGHWQAVAMEQAGFIMHPMHAWVFHQGMPKAHDAAKAIDKHLGVEGSPEAQQWDGWAYGTATQKPALEPIYLAQKPFSEKTGAANLLKHGVGALNIDGCRVPIDLSKDASQLRQMNRSQRLEDTSGQTWGLSKLAADTPQVVKEEGRWPANLILDGSDEAVALFDNNSDRFYHQFNDLDPIICHPKAGKADRAESKHPTVKPIALMQYLIRHITPPGGIVLDPFAGSGTTGEAAKREGFDCILMEAETEYVDFLRQRFNLPVRNNLSAKLPVIDSALLDIL